jgi:uncharacterized protein
VNQYQDRFYRSQTSSATWVSFTLQVKESDLWVRARQDVSPLGYERLFQYRHDLETYIQLHPDFKEALVPLPFDPLAPPIVQDMLKAARLAQVGPMAAVAGAIADFIGRDLLTQSSDLIIENGGDLFIASSEPLTIGLFAGKSPLSQRLAIHLEPTSEPIGLCTSSGTVGHSLSFGKADAVTVLSSTATMADALATAIGNRVRTRNDISDTIDFARTIPEVQGVLIIVAEQVGLWGDLELVAV